MKDFNEKTRIKRADIQHLSTVRHITRETISAIYPLYYPQGVVAFFLQHHSDANILQDIQKGLVYLLYDNANQAIGTVTIKKENINRLFVLPAYQGQGNGRKLMDFAEGKIFENYTCCQLDASLPAKLIYLKRGFKEFQSHVIATESGEFLCYDVMQKWM